MTVAIPALLTGLLCLAPGPPVEPDGQGTWPLAPTPEVVRGFDPPGSAWGAGHRGVDLAGDAGQVVRAALAGQVLWAGMLAGRHVLVLGHGATRTTYEPVTATVAVGDLVVGGEPIGTLDLIGSHCQPAACLHWGWLRDDTYLDPLDLIGAEQIRLLPLDGLPQSASVAKAAPVKLPARRTDQPPDAASVRRIRERWLLLDLADAFRDLADELEAAAQW